jgi:transketolase
MSIEDLALATALPGFAVMSPADDVSMRALVHASAAYNGPVFIRAGRAKCALIYPEGTKFEIGKAVELAAGKDLTIIAHGLLVAESIRAAEALEGEGISARVIDMHTIKPLDRDAIARAARETGAILVAEEHLVDGGLGVKVAQVVTEMHPCHMAYVGVQNRYAESGTPEGLLEKYGFRASHVAAAARSLLARKRG